MSGKEYRTDWIEVGGGLLLLAFAAGIRETASVDPRGAVVVMLLVMGMAASYLVHLFARRPLIYGSIAAFVLAGHAAGGYWAFLETDAPALLLFVLAGAAHAAALAVRYRRFEGPSGSGAKGMHLLAATYLMLLGVASAAKDLAPEWFRALSGVVSEEGADYLLESVLLIFAGAFLFSSVTRRWKGRRRAAAACVGAGAIALVSALGFRNGDHGMAFALAAFAVLQLGPLLKEKVRFSAIPSGKEGRHGSLTLFGFEGAGKIALWGSLGWGGVYFALTSGGVDVDLFFLATAVSAAIGILSWHVRGERPVGQLASLLVVLGHIAAFGILLAATNGIDSPYVFFTYVLIFAASVVLRSKYVGVPVLLLVGIYLTSLLAEASAAGALGAERLREFVFVMGTIAVTGLFTFTVTRSRERSESNLTEANERLRHSVRQVEDEREKNRQEAERLRRANEDLVEMRSALMNVLEDVEESKRQIEEDHLRENAVFEALGEGVAAADADGDVILFNPTAEKITGKKRDEVLGKPVESVLRFYLGDDAVLQTEGIRSALKGESARLHPKMVLQDAAGKYVPVGGTVRPFFGTAGEVAGIVVAFRDITLERTIDDQKSSFISVASHQLRTPLSAMRWYVDLLLEGDAGKLTAKQKEFLGDVHSSIRRMSSLVNDLLNVSRAEEGRLRVKPERIEVSGLLDEILEEVRPLADERAQTIETDLGEKLVIEADPTLVRQVFSNLLGNAVKYTPEGGKVGIRASVKGDEALFAVWDDGYGIPKEQQRHIFEKFYRGERAVTMETVGTGLGLYIAKSIVEASNGRIWFESKEGRGTTFYVALPLTGRKGTLEPS